jgi:hypothetical protein
MLTAEVSTPNTSPISTQSQQVASSLPDFSYLVITAVVTSLLSGSAVAALITGIFNARIKTLDREHEEKLQRVRSEYDARLNDELRRKLGQEALIKTWLGLLGDASVSIQDLCNHPTFPSLYPYLESHSGKAIRHYLYENGYLKNTSLEFMLSALILEPQVFDSENFNPVHPIRSEEALRFEWKNELARLSKEWGFI